MRTKSWQNENFVGKIENKVGRMPNDLRLSRRKDRRKEYNAK